MHPLSSAAFLDTKHRKNRLASSSTTVAPPMTAMVTTGALENVNTAATRDASSSASAPNQIAISTFPQLAIVESPDRCPGTAHRSIKNMDVWELCCAAWACHEGHNYTACAQQRKAEELVAALHVVPLHSRRERKVVKLVTSRLTRLLDQMPDLNPRHYTQVSIQQGPSGRPLMVPRRCANCAVESMTRAIDFHCDATGDWLCNVCFKVLSGK